MKNQVLFVVVPCLFYKIKSRMLEGAACHVALKVSKHFSVLVLTRSQADSKHAQTGPDAPSAALGDPAMTWDALGERLRSHVSGQAGAKDN